MTETYLEALKSQAQLDNENYTTEGDTYKVITNDLLFYIKKVIELIDYIEELKNGK